MVLHRIRLKNWRNGADNYITFSPGITVIAGGNAAGKTNLLEGICYFSAGKSFRGCKDNELIRFDTSEASADIEYTSNKNKQVLSVRLKKNARRALYKNGVPVTKVSEFLGSFRCVVFAPEHLDLVKGSPEGRRKFMDMAICQSFPRHVAVLNEYNRLLIQKNAHLKGDLIVPELLDVYDERMAVLAANITSNRRKYACLLEEFSKVYLKEISGGSEELSVMYVTQGDGNGIEQIEKTYLALFKAKRQSEIERRMTLCGPQKDDFITLINRRSAKLYGSQGQQRSVVIAMKLAEGEISRNQTGESPVFLFDDVLSELDNSRRQYILNRLSGKQVIITDTDDKLKSVTNAKIVYVKDGICS